jgi:hypothetical protein
MTLSIHINKVKDGTSLWEDDKESGGKKLNGLTFTLGMTSIACGFPAITERNVKEVWRRVDESQKLYGALMGNAKGPVWFTKEDIVRHIGLRTNATNFTKAEFDAKMARLRAQDERDRLKAERYAAKEKKEA